MSTIRNFNNYDSRNITLPIRGILVGACSGLVVSLFRYALAEGEHIRTVLIDYANSSSSWLVGGLFLLILAWIVTALCVRVEPLSGGSGIPQVKGELAGQIEQNWYRIIIAKFIGGFAAISAGLSLGREGPSVQIGAMAGKGVAKLSKSSNTDEKLLMTCGAAAGLAGAFCAPLAGTMFALEELHKNFSILVMTSTMAASIASDFVATNIFGLKPAFEIHITHALPLSEYGIVIVLGILLGAFGVFYNKCIEFFQNVYGRINLKVKGRDLSMLARTAIPFATALVLYKVYPIVLGGGSDIVNLVGSENKGITFLLILLVVKFVFSMMSFGTGVAGGIFLPLLVLGAVCGGLFGDLLQLIGMDGGHNASWVILGMVGCFTAIVRAPVTGVLLLTEMTGEFTNFMPLTIVSLTAYITADILRGEPIYDQLLSRMLTLKSKKSSAPNDYVVSRKKKRKLLVESEVYVGSYMDGRSVNDIGLPHGCLIVAVERNDRELVPNGQTVLYAGDKLLVFSAESDVMPLREHLDKVCKSINDKSD